MQTYTLIYPQDRRGEAKKIEFNAEDPSSALRIAQDEAPERSAELWEGTKKICTLHRRMIGTDDLWTVTK
ncbi:hypothetical protein GCM10011371_18190 [Novosphingobium marinum]|uniref:Uncharacterized protein n=1 Tax=Novosphingobium marinum TaxID=1514948 RepID=A0A7Z0BTE9_9SPHN|nr:hypothetical protein [Novosphingobium marinum]NYH95931.1 hypothetical protein [Novosphingobium marinum]GGC31105.1 hypothetical protein GCM10011371_18190 [Novosphingobium marinum]